MNENKHILYLSDLSTILVEKIENLSGQKDKDDYIKGQVFAYYDVLDLMKQQAEVFDIPIEDLNLQNICLESYLGGEL